MTADELSLTPPSVPPPLGAAHLARRAPGSQGLLSAAHSLWKPLTAPLLPGAEGAAGNWLTGTTATAKAATPAPCVLGEWVYVEVEIENPMHVPLNLSGLQLSCSLTADAATDTAAADAADAPAADAAPAPPSAAAPRQLEADVQALALPAGRRSLVRLGVRPLAEGQLAIEGVAWTLNDVAHGSHALELHGKRLNQTRAQRVGRVYAFDQSLSMRVVPPMPLLQAAIEGLPQTLLLGQVANASIVLSNIGRTPLASIRLRISQPAFCVVGDPDAAPPAPPLERAPGGGVTVLEHTRPTHVAEMLRLQHP